MTKLEQNKQKKQDSLFNTAFELFTSKGIHKTTISDIVEKAGVAKGTFYLYFTDKYDVRNKLISKKAGELFIEAGEALKEACVTGFEKQLIFLIDYIVQALNDNKTLLNFISRNLSWGVFKSALDNKNPVTDNKFYDTYLDMLQEDVHTYENPEIMLFTIIELTGSTCYSCILYNEPMPMEQYVPYLNRTVSTIIRNHIVE